ncbi:MAG: hypothetical protein GY714_27210 [Desulfobacterales bacterium]|nr:hypothetical protein [Desulfobacterales bacterium]
MGLKEVKKLAKFLEYVLGRRPDEFGLVPDKDGFVKIKDLLKGLSEEDGYKFVRKGSLNEIQLTLSAPTFEITENSIRAINRELKTYSHAEEIPNLIYTSVREKAYSSVLSKGLYPQGNDYIVLSKDKDMAIRIGKRRDKKPIILEVSVGIAKDEGAFFYTCGPNLFLTKYLSKDCLFGPPAPKEKPDIKRKKKAVKQELTILDPFEDDVQEDYIPGGDKGSWKRNKKKFRREKKKFD